MNILKSNKKRRTFGAAAILITVMLTATACSTNNNSNNEPTPSAEPTPVVSATPDASNDGGVTDPGTASPDGNGAEGSNDVSTAPADAESSQGEGVFVGLADSHTVEIELADGAQSFQFEDELSDTINGINSDSKVKFEYVEKKIEADGQTITQKWLTKIEASN